MKKLSTIGLVVLSLLMLAGCNEYTDSLANEDLCTHTVPLSSQSDAQVIPAPWQRGFRFPTNLCDSQVVSAPVGITMNISSYTASGLSFYFENLTENEFTYGKSFALYTLINNAWEPVEPTIESHWAFRLIGFLIPPNSTTEERVVDWEWLFGDLPSGDYRFQKSVLYRRKPGDIDVFFMGNVFTLP